MRSDSICDAVIEGGKCNSTRPSLDVVERVELERQLSEVSDHIEDTHTINMNIDDQEEFKMFKSLVIDDIYLLNPLSHTNSHIEEIAINSPNSEAARILKLDDLEELDDVDMYEPDDENTGDEIGSIFDCAL